jgi:hypothetical protein
VFVAILAGQVIVGAWLSTTVTVNEHVAVLPLVSVAVQVTVLVPRAKVEPLVGAQLLVTPGQLSPMVGALQVIAGDEQVPDAVFVAILAGQVIVGAWLSTTVTVKLQLFVLPLASVAVHVTVLLPVAKLEPLAGTQL